MGARVKILSLLFLLIALGIYYKLFYWQIIRGKDLANQSRGQYQASEYIPGARGSIFASDGSLLVGPRGVWTLFAIPKELSQGGKSVAEKIAPFFTESEEDRQATLVEIDRIDALLSKSELNWVPIRRRVDRETKVRIESLKIDGLGFEQDEGRIYSEASSAAQLLGFLGKDERGENLGYFGLEGEYDIALSSKPGFKIQEKDARGIPILLGNAKEVSSTTGVSLATHIDKSIQFILEKKISEGIEKYGAKESVAIVMNPKDGAILAMASFPSYDPIRYWEFGDEYFKNPAISSIFEPGSIFKILVMAGGLDTGVIKPETKCDICEGPLKIDKYLIETWDKKYQADATMTDVIVHSNNVGMTFVSQKLGADSLYDYLHRFGIGEATGIDLQGEVSGSLRERGSWNIVDLAVAGFGQGISVTPIQMLGAVSAIANDGELVRPQVVDKLVLGGWQEDIRPEIGDKVISKKTADEITSMMVEAAKNGEAKWTNTPGFSVAGKTGTAQIPIAGHYDEEKTIASFVGFAPAQDPKFVMIVTLREPASSPWASETAAPLWYSIAKDLFIHFGIQPEG